MKAPKYAKTDIVANDFYEGDTIETQMERVMQNKESIESTSPIIYTEKTAGVEPQYDIRTDRWEIAQNAMNSVDKSRREQERQKEASKSAEGTKNTEDGDK